MTTHRGVLTFGGEGYRYQLAEDYQRPSLMGCPCSNRFAV